MFIFGVDRNNREVFANLGGMWLDNPYNHRSILIVARLLFRLSQFKIRRKSFLLSVEVLRIFVWDSSDKRSETAVL